MQSNLANATVTWYNGGNTEPVAASFDPTSLTALTADHLYVSESSYDERKDHYVIAKVVPGAGNWTDASLLRSMEARSMEAGISIAAGTRGIGTDSYRNLTLLKADEYDSGEGVMKPRHDGAGWYYYKIPKDNFFDTGYTTSVLEGDTPEIFDLSNQTVTQDVNAKTVTVDGEPVALTPLEYDILCFLMQNAGTVFSPQEIYRRVWHEEPAGDNPVAVHIRHIREKIEINPAEPRYLKVVWGKGYKMEGERR